MTARLSREKSERIYSVDKGVIRAANLPSSPCREGIVPHNQALLPVSATVDASSSSLSSSLETIKAAARFCQYLRHGINPFILRLRI